MKHKLPALCCAFTMLTGATALAADFTAGGLYYNIVSAEEKTVEVAFDRNGKYEAELVIPSSVENAGVTYTVVSIDHNAFSRKNLTSVKIPETVTNIGNYAFSFNHFETVTLPESVTTLGNQVFANCSEMTSAVIPGALTIGERLFANCLRLETVTVSATEIPGNTFDSCSDLKSVTFSSHVEKLPLEESFLKDNVYLVDINVDAANKNYSSSDGVLYNKDATELILCPRAKTSISILPTTTVIKADALAHCKSISSLTIPDAVTTIGDGAFLACPITTVDLPLSVSSVGHRAFGGCVKLMSINAAAGSEYFTTVGGVLYNKEMTAVVAFPEGLKEFTIPPTVTSIPDHAFEGAAITSIVIPETVTSIGVAAFNGCSNLKAIVIPNSVKTIGTQAFGGCFALESVALSNSLTEISGSLFAGCGSLVTLDIPEGVTTIGRSAFYECRALTSIKLPSTLTTLGHSAFSTCMSLKTVTIPASVTSLGQNVFRLCAALESVDIQCEMTTIPQSFFTDCAALKSFVIPETVTNIEYGAFMRCSSLESMVIPASVKEIGRSAFRDCKSLSEIKLSEGLEIIGEANFNGCESLKTIDIPASVTSIVTTTNDTGSFAGCTSLAAVNVAEGNSVYKSVGGVLYNKEETEILFVPLAKSSLTVPETITTIAENVFTGNTTITEVTLPQTLTAIDNSAFANCTSLEKIEIPASVTSIGESAFSGCTSLTVLYSYAEVPPVCGLNAFGRNARAISVTTLYVPAGCKAAYEAAAEWQNIPEIIEMGDSSIEDIISGCADVEISVEGGEIIVNGAAVAVEIFDLSGKKVFSGISPRISGLASGLYIVRAGSAVRKVRL